MMKNTVKREKIIAILREATAPLTAEEIYAKVASEMEVNLSTVYRTLHLLVSHHYILKSIQQDGKYYFELNDHTHKHHLICNRCHEMLTIQDCPIDTLEEKVSHQTGYHITEHILELRGLCPKCSQKK